MAAPGEAYTDYVATRWYRAPELLVGDNMYNESVDVWSIGCLLIELLNGEPLFPGDSDIDQIYHITKCLGNLITYHRELFNTNSLFRGLKLPIIRRVCSIERRFPKMSTPAIEFIQTCLNLDPRHRAGSDYILNHDYFIIDSFRDTFVPHLAAQARQEYNDNILLQRLGVTVYGSAFRQFPPSPIPEVLTPESPTSPLKKDNTNVTRRKSNRSDSHLQIELPPSEGINPIERLLKEVQKQSFLNHEIAMRPSLPQEPSHRLSKDLIWTDSPNKLSRGYLEKDFKRSGRSNLTNLSCSPIMRLTPEREEVILSPKRASGARKNNRSSFDHCLELPPHQTNPSKRKHTNTNGTNEHKTSASFLPNLIPKEKHNSKTTQLRALPNPETVLATRKWNEKQSSFTKISDPPKIQPNIPQLTAIDVSYIPHNDSDESFIV